MITMRVTGIGLALVVIAALLWARGTGAPVSLDLVALATPEEVTAGQPLEIGLRARADVSGQTPVVVRSAGATHRYTVDVTAGAGSLRLPAPVATRAGTIQVLAGGLDARIRIRPGPAVDPVDTLVGPRTIVADGADRTLGVVVPVDEHGNTVADGTEIRFGWTQPGGVASGATTSVERGIAWTFVTAGTRAGTTEIHASSGPATGRRVRISEVPGTPAAVEVLQPAGPLVADGRSVIVLETAPLVDRFGNVLPDGVEGHFRVQTAGGLHIVPATAQRGALIGWWSAPAVPGATSISAVVNGVVAAPVPADFDPAVAAIPAAARWDGRELIVSVGPVTDPDGALVADGTPVRVGPVGATLRAGRADVRLLDARDRIQITVLGVETTAEVGR